MSFWKDTNIQYMAKGKDKINWLPISMEFFKLKKMLYQWARRLGGIGHSVEGINLRLF